MNYNKKSVEDIDVKGKRVLCRCDFNVPTKEGKITSDKRIVAAMPTIEYLVNHGARVILCSHMGKPKGEWKPELSLQVVADRLSELLGKPVVMAKDVVGEDAKAKAAALKDGDKVTLVEPSILPDAMIDPVCAVLADAPGVGSAYLSVMIVNGDARSYLLVLDGPKDEKLFASVAQAARPYLLSREKKMDLNITTSISPLGQQGMQGSEPFYRKGIGRVIEEDDDE